MRRAAILLPIVALPLIEIFVIGLVGSRIGAWNTFLLILAGVAVGGLVIRYEGRRMVARFRAAASDEGAEPRGSAPAELSRAAADTGLVMLGGLLFVLPGFVSDVLGLLCVLPFTRPLVRMLIGRAVAGQVARRTRFGMVVQEARRAQRQARARGGADDKVVDGEVIQGRVVHKDDPAHPWTDDGGSGSSNGGRRPHLN